MKRIIKRLILIIIFILILNMNVILATDKIQTKTIMQDTPNSISSNILKGEKYIAQASNDNMTMLIIEDKSELEKITINDEESVYYNNIFDVGIPTQVYFTKDMKNFEKADLSKYLTEFELNKSYIEYNSIWEKDGTFYILVDITIYDRQKYSNNQHKYAIIKTEDGKNFSEVMFEDNEGKDIYSANLNDSEKINMYFFNNTYIWIKQNYLMGDKKCEGIYYTTTDFKNWTKRILPTQTKNYKLQELVVCNDGISFIFLDETDKDYKYISYATNDFVNYSCIEEKQVKENIIIDYSESLHTYNALAYPSGIIMLRHLKLLYKSSCFEEYKLINKIPEIPYDYGNNDDEYIGQPYDRIYYFIQMVENNNAIIENNNVIIYYNLWAIENDGQELANMIVTNTETNNTIEYDTDIMLNKINSSFSSDYGEMFMLYDNNKLLSSTDKDFSTIKQINLNGEYKKIFIIEGKNQEDKIVILGEENSLIFNKENIIKKNLKLNETTKRITNIDINNLTVNKIKEKIKEAKNILAENILKIVNSGGKEITEEEKIGTGTTIKIKEGTEEKEYTALIYGDCTGDGKINAIDALAVIKNKTEAIKFTKTIFEEAGRITSTTGTPSAIDALAIIKQALGTQTINQDK